MIFLIFSNDFYCCMVVRIGVHYLIGVSCFINCVFHQKFQKGVNFVDFLCVFVDAVIRRGRLMHIFE